MRPHHLSLLLLFAASPVFADPVISEFMASNQTGITDETGARPDWIEIRNPDSAPVLMTGWSLTDNALEPRKWSFPAVNIPAKGFLLVYASGNDRRIVGQNLHTNFSLAAGGEYLALVKPDGTKSTEFAPSFPRQYPDISYGTSLSSATTTWVQQSSPVRATVPTSTALIPQWRTLGFDDSTWTSGTFGVGFMNAGSSPNLSADLGITLTGMVGTGRHSYSRTVFNVADKNALISVLLKMNYDDGFVAWINGAFAASSSSVATSALVDPISITATATSHNPGSFEDFPISASALAALVNGPNVLAIENFNTSASSSDAIVIPQLIGTLNSTDPGVTGYFTVATPGTANGGPNTIQLPNEVTFSRAPGTYTTAFSLTLGGALAGQEIRYTISDPGSNAANLLQPTTSSTLYTTPIPFTMTNGRMIRAAIFEGGQKSRVVTAQFLPLETGAVTANTSNFSSTLPIIVMDDHGAGQPVNSDGNTYTTSTMHVFPLKDGIARLADATSGMGIPEISTRSGIRIRGSSSAGFSKKSYGLETWDETNVDKDFSILGLSADSDWILSGPTIYDKTFIHNSFIFEVSRRIGRWAPRTVPVEMFFNQNGGKLDYNDYAGVYILTEKIKSTSDRLNITGIKPWDNAGTALTGGYIFKIDRPDGNEFYWSYTNTPNGPSILPDRESGQYLVLVEPDPDVDTTQQQVYIRDTAVKPWNDTLFAERATSFATRNYRNHIDVSAFVDHHLLNSLAYNVDALRLSAFYHKDRGGKIAAGPIWDFDRALNSGDRDTNPSSWSNIEYYFTRDWWGGLFRDPQFVQEMTDRWWQLRQPGQPFEQASLIALVDFQAGQIGNTIGARDAARWPGDDTPRNGSYLGEVTLMKNWLNTRGTYLDNSIPRPPDASVASGPVNAGSTVTLSGTGTIRYTLDGTDPRPFGGATPGTGTIYSTPLTLNATTVVTARRQGTFTPFPQGAASISWSAPRTRVYLVNESFAMVDDIAVTEVNYHPTSPTAAELATAPGSTADDYEWIEIKNVGTRTVNTFEMSFPASYPFEKELRLSPRTLAPGDTALVVRNRVAFQARYGSAQNAKIVGEYLSGSLSDSGEEVRLLARDGTNVAVFTYSDGSSWPGRADGKGSTLEYKGTAYASADYNTAANWRSSSELHGSPGTTGLGPDSRVVINEVLSQSTAPRVDAIELRNNSNTAVDVGGWYLSDSGSVESIAEYMKFAIPAGTVIQPGGYAVFTETSFNPNGSWNPVAGAPGPNEFAFDGLHGDDAWLISNTGGVLRFSDHVEFGSSRPDESWGRLPNGTGPFIPLATRTLLDENSVTTPRPGLGADNSAARVGPLLIQEIQHTPVSGNTDEEFVEIANPGSSPVSLSNWALRGEVDFLFTTEIVPARGVIVVVPFAPSDAAKAAAFRATYGIGESVILAGPWGSSHLGLNGTLTLYRAETPPVLEPSYIPMTVEDAVTYSATAASWPITTNGNSLNRISAENGSVSTSWSAQPPSPGNTNLRFGAWKATNFPNGGEGSGDLDDPDGDGINNALEFALRTNPLVADNPSAVLPQFTSVPGAGGTTDFQFTYTLPLNGVGVSAIVQKSADLNSWTTVPDAQVSVSAGTETRRATVNSAGQERIYFRLNVTITP